jgi:hypothetical protein
MSNFIYSNFFNTTLSAPIASTGATSMTISSTTNAPVITAGQIWVVVLNDAATQGVFEVVYVTARTGAVCTITRGQEGSAAATWLTNDFAYAPDTAGVLNNFVALSPGSAQTGNISLTGTALTTNLQATSLGTFSSPSGLANGSVTAQDGAATGSLWLGGSGAAGRIDFGSSNSTAFTASAAFYVKSGIIAALASSSYSVIPGTNVGDLVSQTSASTGSLFMGGATSNGQIDWNVTVAGAHTVSAAMVARPVINSTTTSGFLPPIYQPNGTITASTVHMVKGTVTGTGSAQTITLTGSAVFADLTYYAAAFVSSSGLAVTTIVLSTSSFTVNGTTGQQISYYAIGV